MVRFGKDWVMHRGDCLDVMRGMDAGSVDFIFTDPPYGHNNNGDLIHRREADRGRLPFGGDPPMGRPIANDGAEANEVFRNALPEFKRLLASNCCCCCCCGGGGPDPQFARWSLWLDEVLSFKQMVVWDKGKMGMGWHYRRSYETVLVAQKGKGKTRWYDESKRVENIIRPGDYGIKKIIPRADQHPTEKPVALARHFILLHTKPGDLVLDPFAGRGSTGQACLETGRRFVGVEMDRDHFRLACARLHAAEAAILQPAA